MPDQFTETFQNILRRIRALEMKEINSTAIEALIPPVPPYPDPTDIDIYPGADIDISSNVIGRKGTNVLTFSSTGALLAEHPRSSLQAALNASLVGDIVLLPAGMITADPIIPPGVTLCGLGWMSIIDGLVTGGASSLLQSLAVVRVANQVGILAGVTVGATGTFYLKDVKVDVQNSGGPAYAVYMTAGGNLRVAGGLLAEVGTEGYAAWVSSGNFYHDTGRAIGTVDKYPYWLEA